ncbi:hypothetical protein [Adlercreutzia sp. ZJ141]|uniref:hypothetical protein n=1 Tax=Adlercreutzia sp. ZJ141 TaxID=2709406 RepID=UPI0013EA1F40|nr:hypothetical protein [Adlercreutzia sp. ZJ141]
MSVKSHINSYYSAAVVGRIVEKYGIAPMDALNSYLHSETHRMFLDPELAMFEFSPEGIILSR